MNKKEELRQAYVDSAMSLDSSIINDNGNIGEKSVNEKFEKWYDKFNSQQLIEEIIDEHTPNEEVEDNIKLKELFTTWYNKYKNPKIKTYISICRNGKYQSLYAVDKSKKVEDLIDKLIREKSYYAWFMDEKGLRTYIPYLVARDSVFKIEEVI